MRVSLLNKEQKTSGETFGEIVGSEGFEPKHRESGKPGASGRTARDTSRPVDTSPDTSYKSHKLDGRGRHRQTAPSTQQNYLDKWCVPGFDKAIKRLRKGNPPCTSESDLHGLTSGQASAKLKRFIDESYRRNHRAVRIICGRGQHSPDGKSILKPVACEIMRSHPLVRGYCIASMKHGADGAYYVLLKTRKTTYSG